MRLSAATDPRERPHVRESYVESDELIRLAGEHEAGLQSNGLPLGWMVIEEDIQVPVNFFEETRATFERGFWSEGIIPFEFASNVTQPNQDLAIDAMDLWAGAATLTFRPREGPDDQFLHFRDSTDGNNSPVGPQSDGNTINIQSWGLFTIAHEVAHSLGYWHEQSRPDRNQFIDVVEGNVQSGFFDANFGFHGEAYGPYDFDSIMHYPRCAFSCCSLAPNTCHPGDSCADSACWTIRPLPPNEGVTIGQRNHLSVWDKKVMSFMYPQGDWRFVDETRGIVGLGTFLAPWDTLEEGLNQAPTGGRLIILRPLTYGGRSIYDRAMVIEAPVGGVILN